MSQYDDDADRLGDVCDHCGELFGRCDCDRDEEYVPGCVKCGRVLADDTEGVYCGECGGGEPADVDAMYREVGGESGEG
jgi:ribosomal protein S27AE